MPIRLPSLLAITAAMVAALTLSACGTSPMAEPPPPSATTVQPARLEAALVAHTWKLVSARDNDGRYMSALFPANSKPVTFNFAEGRISIQGGCNVRGGAFQKRLPAGGGPDGLDHDGV